ncbi:MAG: zinc ribbon domain-containing protein, partial [Planctomycetota bacterium]
LAMKSMTGKTVECPFCSSLNVQSAKKCSVCGEYLFEQKIEVLLLDDEVLCPKCKSVQRKGTGSCGECGALFCKRCKVKLAVQHGYCSACADFRTRVTKPQG